MISVEIEKKLKSYQGNQVLKLSKEFEVGSITGISGPSGVGKTTLLKMIAGFIQPEKGTIIANHDTWLDTNSKISLSPQKRMAGFVFQDYALFPNMTVKQHLEYASKDTSWINRLLCIGKLETFSNHKPVYLSGGQQQRLAILRALAIKPKLLLMDEPFSALDPEMKNNLISELKEIFKVFGMTVLVVSHNIDELRALISQELLIST